MDGMAKATAKAGAKTWKREGIKKKKKDGGGALLLCVCVCVCGKCQSVSPAVALQTGSDSPRDREDGD